MSRAARAGVASDDWRRFLPRRRQMLWGVLIAFVASAALVAIGYAVTPIPNASEFATSQATTLYYSDGKTKLATLPGSTRIDVPLSDVPRDVQQAVLAAEDRHFYNEPGISPTGILRALWTDLRGGEISQGGSTITQQYVKNAYLTSARTFTRKFKEIFISVKLANSRTKREILKDYLNTIYFGRGAYGIQAAAHAYFGEDVRNLNVAQGAVLAATISQPSYYDPDVNETAAQARWRYVINGMVSEGWLPRDEADSLDYPHVRRPQQAKGSTCTKWRGFICQAVRRELEKRGFDDTRLDVGGYRVVTTIDKDTQLAAVKAEADQGGHYVKHGIDKGRESALVSVQPGDGAIRAMYGGDEFCTHEHPDDCTDLTGVTGEFGGADYRRRPGSSFKPYTLIAALKSGVSLDSTFHGPSHIDFPGTNGNGISNSEGETCGTCTLTQALAKSINTIFVPLAQKVGPEKVVEAAHDAGIPKAVDLPAVPAITLGTEPVSPLDQAVGFATIAAQGERAEPYLVARVETRKHDVVYRAKQKTSHEFDADVMADTTYAMTKVLDCASGGTGCGRALSGRPAAGKTGTVGADEVDTSTASTGNVEAWFIGFTPQLSTAVWYGNSNHNKPVTTNGAPLYGGMLPAATWQEMMNAALVGKPVESFPPPAHVGTFQGTAPSPVESTPSPTESPSESTTPTLSPTVSPTVVPPGHTKSPSPTSSPTPSPSPSPTQTAQGNAPPSPG